jgi:hypothetical protein
MVHFNRFLKNDCHLDDLREGWGKFVICYSLFVNALTNGGFWRWVDGLEGMIRRNRVSGGENEGEKQ